MPLGTPSWFPTLATDGALPAPEPRGLTSAGVRLGGVVSTASRTAGVAAASVALTTAGVAVLALRTARTVQALRREAAGVEALDQSLDLSGDWPVRKVLVFGDSAAAGHGLASADQTFARQVGRALHANDGRATTVRTVAVDGATTATILATQLDAVLDAEVVVIGVGVNDAFRGRRVGAVREDLRALLQGVRTRLSRRATVVLLTCPDLSVAPGLPPALRPIVGWRCRVVARMQARVAAGLGVTVVPADRTVLTADMFGADGIHPGAAGHAAVADVLLRHLLG